MSKPAFLVEGDLEQMFVQNVCPKVPVQKIGLNGESVSLAAIAKRVGTLGRLLQKKGYRPLVIVFDRERRSVTCQEIEEDLRTHLVAEDITTELIIGIPDRDIENWILADHEMFATCTGANSSDCEGPFEGAKGKAKIRELLPKGGSYVETIEGVAWLKKCRPRQMAARSASFSRFAEALRGLGCWWLQPASLDGI